MLGPLLKVQMWFCVGGARDSAPCQKWTKRKGFVTFPKALAGAGHLKRIRKDAFSVAGAVQETCSSGRLGGPGADFQFWEHNFARQVQHFVWPGITFSWQAQYFRQVEWKNRKAHWHEAVSSALNFLFLKAVSQNCFLFWCCQVQKLKKSRRIVSFLTLSSSKIKDVSQNCSVFDVVKFKNWGSLAE